SAPPSGASARRRTLPTGIPATRTSALSGMPVASVKIRRYSRPPPTLSPPTLTASTVRASRAATVAAPKAASVIRLDSTRAPLFGCSVRESRDHQIEPADEDCPVDNRVVCCHAHPLWAVACMKAEVRLHD